MKNLSIDIESYSSVNLAKSGVYRYAEAPDFEVLLFGYSADGAPVKVVDLAAGETIPADVRSALTDPAVTKWAFNAQFERVCLSRYLGYPTGQYLDPSSWHCTMVWAATLGLPLSLEGVGAVLGLEKQKLKEGKDLIRYFCTPAKARDGSLIRHYPTDAPEKWSLFKAYNLRDVETEMSIQQKLSKFPVTESEWRNYTLDQQINDRGIMLDRSLVTQAIRCDERFKRTHMEQARSVTGLDNPNSPVQLKAWLAEKGVAADSLSKAAVADMLEKADGEVELALSLRQELAKSSVKKYTAMQTVVGSDDRARGLIQFYGANRTGRYAGRLIQVQNLPQNHLPDLDTARALVRSGNTDAVEMLYDSVPLVLSELIRTAFVPKPGCRFYVADFSAIEARVIAWIAGEHWRQEVFANGGDIYCASASQMFHVPVEKHGVNGHLRQKGKIAELALGYGGSVGALKAMGALNYGLTEDELVRMCEAKGVLKVSRRDLPIVVAQKLTGATTVATTMILANMAGIHVFATGGIGGVHRRGEVTMDVSADLQELAHTPVAVVCAGAKMILDIGRTLEYLETMGVPVLGLNTDDFPAFYCRKSGFGVDYNAKTPADVAAIAKAKWGMGLEGGMLIGNPVPEEYAMDFDEMSAVIDRAMAMADEAGVKGKNITPFLLAHIVELTGGNSLKTNIQLAYNNARAAAQIAVELAK